MRLGICLLIFFLWRHFTSLHDADMAGEEDAIEMEKKEISGKIKDAKKAGMSSREVAGLQIALERLGQNDSGLAARCNESTMHI